MVNRSDASLTQPAVDAAVAEWAKVLGGPFVVCDTESLQRVATATFATSARVAAILKPATREEVQRSVEIANRFSVALYPVSSGKNWGYGSAAPVRDSVIVDLSRLNRIVDFDEELAYVTIEPGVTQRQLHDFLREKGSHLWMDATGSSPDCSIIGNTLERGFGHTPMGDHCSAACGYEVVLPSGACIQTGFSRFAHTRTGPLSRWGLGPSLDGLFSQSNFGIVTRMSVWLMRAPEYFQAFFFQTEKSVGVLVDALRPLRVDGTIRSVVHFGNDYKVLSGTSQYPWQAHPATPLGPEAMRKLRRTVSIAAWSGSGALYGTRAQVREARRLVRAALSMRVERLRFVDERKLALLERLEPTYRMITGRDDIRRALMMLPSLVQLMKGVPNNGFLSSVYWRKKRSPPQTDVDPDRDSCGLLWCSPLCPNTASDVEAVTGLATELTISHGFEPIISVSLVNERSAVSTVAITYDRSVQGEDLRAFACYEALLERLLAAGYPPYRLNVSSMKYGGFGGDYAKTLKAIKAALDPEGILAPGRYEPSS